MQAVVRPVAAVSTHPVRREVLRGGNPDSVVVFPGDDDPGALHLAAFDPQTNDMIGVATFFPSPYDGEPAYQLRGMAVVDSVQGKGVGATLLDDGLARLRAMGVGLVWANARDTALGFYERHGWKVVGDGFIYGPVNLPHHVVVFSLRA